MQRIDLSGCRRAALSRWRLRQPPSARQGRDLVLISVATRLINDVLYDILH